MNILFYMYGKCIPTSGGIQRVSDILANYMSKEYGYGFVCVYKESSPLTAQRTIFQLSYEMPVFSDRKMADIIDEYEIDVIINQEVHWDSIGLRNAVNLSGRKVKIIYCYHNLPMADALEHVKFSHIYQEFKSDHSLKSLVKTLIYPVYRHVNLRSIKKRYKEAYDYSDKVVLLSESFKKAYTDATGLKCNDSGITAIPNPATYDRFADEGVVEKKKKRVLYVGRLYNAQKRISVILGIWSEIEKNDKFQDWTLDIVGDGPDKEMLIGLAKKLNLERVVFHGISNPEPYYIEDSIFLMTSSYEGWGMTLVEASQKGCVPIVLDTFSALHDIVENGVNGMIIPQDDIEGYVSCLTELMCDDCERSRLACNAVEKAKRFSKENVTKRWINLINEFSK